MLFLHGNTFVSPAELFLAFGFEQGRASLSSSLRKQPGTNQKKNQLKKKKKHFSHCLKYLLSCLGYFNLETSPYENPANEEHWKTDYNKLAALLSGKDCTGYMI